MLKHADVWKAIDRLAREYGFSTSGLARQSGLDPTTFNKSKRITREGKLRKIDLTNRVKFLEDCVARCMGIDDRQFFRVVLNKLHASHERTVVRIMAYDQDRMAA